MNINTASASNLLQAINLNIVEVSKEAAEAGVPLNSLKYPTGEYVLHPLLLAKSNCLLAIAMDK